MPSGADIQTRRARPEDANGVSAVLQALTAQGKRRKPDTADFALQHYITHPGQIGCTIAVDLQGTILGFQSLKYARPGNPYGTPPGWGIIGTHIAPHAARQGLGRLLFSATLDHAKTAHLQSIDAAIATHNAQALAFYTALGFTPYRSSNTRTHKRFDLTP